MNLNLLSVILAWPIAFDDAVVHRNWGLLCPTKLDLFCVHLRTKSVRGAIEKGLFTHQRRGIVFANVGAVFLMSSRRGSNSRNGVGLAGLSSFGGLDTQRDLLVCDLLLRIM